MRNDPSLPTITRDRRGAWAIVALSLLLVSALTPGCSDDDGPRTLRGAEVPFNSGKAWIEVDVSEDGDPGALAVVFTEASLTALPRVPGVPVPELVLMPPVGADVSPLDHVTVDWNPAGHEPMHVYDRPHFDFHFYFMSAAERDAIGPFDTIGFNVPLPAAQLAPLYLETPGGVPRMGAHVIDLTSPEIAGTGAFTHTFIYGKYAGRLTFLEPMISEEFLLSKPDLEATIRKPASFGRTGHFPTAYTVGYNEAAKTYRVALTGLTPGS